MKPSTNLTLNLLDKIDQVEEKLKATPNQQDEKHLNDFIKLLLASRMLKHEGVRVLKNALA